MRSTQPDQTAAPALADRVEIWPIDRLVPYAKQSAQERLRRGSDVRLHQGVWFQDSRAWSAATAKSLTAISG